MAIWGGHRSVGLDIGSGAVRVLMLEGTAEKPRIAGVASVQVNDNETGGAAQAIHAALAKAHGDGEAVVAAVGGPDVVIRQLTLPPIPPARILPLLELQHREFGLLPPGEGVLDAQVLRRTKTDCTVLSVSVPKELISERQRLLEQAAVKLQVLDVDALALLNAILHLAPIDARELLVALHVEEDRSLLSILSERGPVVVRYLDTGAAALIERLRRAGFQGPPAQGEDATRAAEACRDVIRRMADGIRMSLAFYRSEYDRESVPRYVLSGWVRLGFLNRALADELRLDSSFEVIDPFQAVRVTAPPQDIDEAAGPEFVQAFGLALRGM